MIETPISCSESPFVYANYINCFWFKVKPSPIDWDTFRANCQETDLSNESSTQLHNLFTLKFSTSASIKPQWAFNSPTWLFCRGSSVILSRFTGSQGYIAAVAYMIPRNIVILIQRAPCKLSINANELHDAIMTPMPAFLASPVIIISQHDNRYLVITEVKTLFCLDSVNLINCRTRMVLQIAYTNILHN